MRRITVLLIILTTCMAASVSAQKIERAEPLSWWVGMKTPLQIMFKGDGIDEFDVRVVGNGVSVTGVSKAESPNYLFVDVEVGSDAVPGEYVFEFTKGRKKIKYPYRIDARAEGSRDRKSFGPEDMMYLLMPDRFANGDPSNDDTPDTIEKSDRKNPHGRHGGDIQGIIDRLGYLEDLGVTAMWSTPLFLDNEPVYSYHGYACADYYNIDPRYGTNDLYKQMVDKAHEHGIKIVMDVVTNHCGKAHWWMNDLPFADWINQFAEFTNTNHAMASYGDPNASEYDKNLCSTGWFDNPMPDMNLDNPFLLHYFKQWAVWWIEWAGLDGLRVDTYPYNALGAMADWTASVRNEYPDINIVGECWFNVPALIAYWEGDNNNRDGFNSNLPSVMDFSWQEAVTQAVAVEEPGWGEGLVRIYNSLTQDFLYRDPRNLLIFLDNHDTPRAADMFDGDPDKMNLAVTMLATMRGVPQLYTGTEVMLRSTDMKKGHGGARVDFPGGWAGDKSDAFTDKGRSAKQKQVFDHARKLFNWRKSMPVIHYGKTLHFRPENNCYVYFRYDDNDVVMVVVNASPDDISVDWNRYGEITSTLKAGVEIISEERVAVEEEFVVKAESSAVIHFVK